MIERIALAPAQLAHDPPQGRDEMLHLHGFQNGDLLARPHRIAFRDIDRDNGAGAGGASMEIVPSGPRWTGARPSGASTACGSK